MRRTYKSKKETCSALDPKDVVRSIDHKSSAFDAFYIQNIKQSKRVLSSLGSTNQHIPGNKVRKRKYVKRIVKDVEPIINEYDISKSTYLTPDKSIRVNRAPDLFDQLLNTTVSPTYKSTNNVFDRLHSDKNEHSISLNPKASIYCIGKLNCSDTDDSDEFDKENKKNSSNYSLNITDLHKHNLIIEKDKKKSKICDDSISNIEKNIHLFNLQETNTKRSDEQNKKNINLQNHRLTKKFQSPTRINSPYTSTPLFQKYRNKSIYNFSPIPMSKFDDNSSENETISQLEKENKCIENITVEHLSKTSFTGDTKEISIKNRTSSVTNVQKQVTGCFNADNSFEYQNNSIINVVELSGDPSLELSCSSVNKSKRPLRELTANKTDMFDDTMCCEPFLGFSNIETEFKNKSFKYKIAKDDKSCLDISDKKSIILHNTNPIGESSYDTCSGSNTSINYFISNLNKNKPVVKLERLNESCFKKYYDKMPVYLTLMSENENRDEQKIFENLNLEMVTVETEYKKNDDNNTKQSALDEDFRIEIEEIKYKSDKNRSDDNESKNSTLDEDFRNETGETEYEADKSRSEDNESKNSSSILDEDFIRETGEKDYETDKSGSDDNGSKHSILDEDFRSETGETEYETDKSICDDCDTKNLINEDFRTESEDTEHEPVSSLQKSIVILEDENDNEERHISFVTVRRRNEISNDSVLIFLNNMSDSSFNSGNSNDTVVSVKHGNNDVFTSSINFNNTDEVKNNLSVICNDGSECLEKNEKESIVKEIVADDNNLSMSLKNKIDLPKSNMEITGKPIVLQAGKKWERSLSIYKRMTIVSEVFDVSILEEEPMYTKGRKYRDSVINTMGMQEPRGLIHHDIHNNSTITSQSRRSTIKIIKESNTSRFSYGKTNYDDLSGFLSEECDDTLLELSKLSIADADHDNTVIEKQETPDRIVTARDYVLRRCNQTDAVLFEECYPEAVLKNCRKIGEGVYGEVFLWRAADGYARVMKVVPVAGSTRVNGEHQKDFNEIISEIVIAMELSALRSPIAEIDLHFDEGKDISTLDLHAIENATDIFNEVLAVRCVYGNYPSRLLDLWDLYDECKGSENDNPAILPIDQQYIVLELANAGQDLESYQFNSAEQAYALFIQVAFGLAVGEEGFQFEHRDLHWGNVLIKPTDQKFGTYVLRGRAHRVPRCGVFATIIDYSLSRLSLPLDTTSEHAALYNDLATDEGLFDAVGDYQFDVYRFMREKLGNEWKNFEPYTNILWLHYTVDKMITALRYKRTNTKIHKQYLTKLKDIKNRILDYGSAVQFVLTDNEY